MASWNTIKLSEIKPDRFDAEYFRKDCQNNIDILESTGVTTNLGRIFHYINRGSQPAYSENGTLKVLRSVNVGFMNFNETRQEYVTESFFENSNRGKVQKDDVLITSTGVGTLGRTSIWYDEEKAYCDSHITILRNSEVDPYLITAFLNTKYGLKQFDQNYRGSSGQIEIYPYDISKFLIPNCIFDYQNEISQQLQLAFSLKKSAYEVDKKAVELLEKKLNINNFQKDRKKFRVTKLSEITDSNRIDSQCFKPEYLQYETFIRENNTYTELKYLLNFISKGNQQNTSKKGSAFYASIKDIINKEVISDSKVNIPSSNGNKEDLLLAVTGATIGKIGIINRYEHISFSGDILCLNVDKNEVSPWYLLCVLSSQIGQTQFNRWITGSTNGHLSPSNVKKIVVPRLDVEDELQIEKYMKDSIDNLHKFEQIISSVRTTVEELIENAAGVSNE